MEQIWIVQVVLNQDLLVHDLDEYWAIVVLLVEVAAGYDLVKLVERHLEHDLVHEFLRCLYLVVQELVF